MLACVFASATIAAAEAAAPLSIRQVRFTGDAALPADVLDGLLRDHLRRRTSAGALCACLLEVRHRRIPGPTGFQRRRGGRRPCVTNRRDGTRADGGRRWAEDRLHAFE